MNPRKILVSTSVGFVLQLAMVITGHYVPWIANNVFMIGGLGISALAGILYAFGAPFGFAASALGGAAAGGGCALLGIAISVALGDVEPAVLAFGTAGSAVTGAIGACLARLVDRT